MALGLNRFRRIHPVRPGNLQYGAASDRYATTHVRKSSKGLIRTRPTRGQNKEFTMALSSGLKKAMFSDATSVDWFEPLPGEKIGMRLESEHTGNAFSLTEIIVAPQAGPPLHIHHDADEVLFVLDGTVDFVCNNERFRTGPGGFAAMPKGVPHAFRNFGNAAARMIVLLSPGGFEQVMRAMTGRPVSDFPSIAATYDLEVVGTQISPIDG
jgi:mannose-6-phosphate isomerase-like protein (cupin superfamily)